MRDLNFHHLYYFLVVAKEGGLTRAAKKLRLGEPAISFQIKKLEQQLETTLFQRKNRRLQLTEAGRFVLNYAEDIFKKGDELLQGLGQSPHVSRSVLRLGAQDSVAKSFTTDVIQSILKHDKIRIEISEDQPQVLFRDIENHRLDLAITNCPYQGDSMNEVFEKRIYQKPVAVYGSRKFSGLRKNFPKSLEGAPLILPMRHTPLRDEIDRYFRDEEIRIDPMVEAEDSAIKKLLAGRNMGLIVQQVDTGNFLIKDMELIKLGELPGVTEELWLVTHTKMISSSWFKQLVASM